MELLDVNAVEQVTGGVNEQFFASSAAGGALGGLAATGTLAGAGAGSALGLAAAASFSIGYGVATALGAGSAGKKLGEWLYEKLN